MEDSNIVRLYWERSENAIAETALKYGKYCFTIADNILQNKEDANESVNDTYWSAWNAIPPNKPTVLRTFLGKLTRRISLKKWRDENREKRGGGEVTLALEELEECIPSGTEVEEEILATELTEILNRFLAGLPETERNIFLCRYWYLDSIAQICRTYRFSESKVKSMLYRTRKKLQNHLNEEGIL